MVTTSQSFLKKTEHSIVGLISLHMYQTQSPTMNVVESVATLRNVVNIHDVANVSPVLPALRFERLNVRLGEISRYIVLSRQ